MTNYERLKRRATRKFRHLIVKISKATTYDDMADIYFKFQFDNRTMSDLLDINICNFCDKLFDCDTNCHKNCKWLSDERKV